MSDLKDTETRDAPAVEPVPFVHLHCHSEFSSLDGGSRVAKMPEILKEKGMTAMGLTDHGVMQGLPEFHDTLKKEGIKPLLGDEIYLTGDRHNHNQRETPTWHLTLLAETNTGYQNLCKISSWSFIEGRITTFGRARARADWELLDRYSEGIICLTGCMAGPVMSELMQSGDLSLARRRTERLVEIFGAENVYGEIQNVGIMTGIPADSEVAKVLGKAPLAESEIAGFKGSGGEPADEVQPGQVPITQTEANRVLVEEICKPLGLRYVATGDVHYLREEDAEPHDTMLCIGTGQLKKGPRRFSLLPKKYHLRSYEEMQEAIPEYPEALTGTVEIAERCSAEITYGKELLPRFPIPEEFADSGVYLRSLCEEGLEELYPEGDEYRDQALERLDMELGVIGSMGFNDYFLIVWDLFREARARNIPYGPGRGSAAGAIVAYTLGITQMDPLREDLLFERFLNPDRVSMPDIDMDFGVALNKDGIPKRDELIEYAKEKYNGLAGCDTAVTMIATFSKFKGKGALKDSARVLAEPTDEGKAMGIKVGNKLASYIPGDPRATMRSVWLDKEQGKALRAAHARGGFEAEVIEQAGWMEGLVKTYGTHAAGVIIGDHDLTDDLPLQQMKADKAFEVQYDMGTAEKIGLLKMDFLGLRNLDVIWDTIEKIKHVRGIDVGNPWRDIPRDDKKTYEMLARGDSIGVFQYECLAGDTIINGDPRKTIADLYVAPPAHLLSVDPTTGSRHRNKVLKVIRSGEKQLFRLVAGNGYTLRATADHKILTADGFKRLGDIKPGDRIAANLRDASRIGACLGCGRQMKSRVGRCTSCQNRDRDSGPAMSANRDQDAWLASLRRGREHPHFGKAPNPPELWVDGVPHAVRSEYEGQMALRLLDLGESYEYEPETFELEDGSGYTPDFYLPEKGLYIEVKGRGGLCGKSKRKVEAFRAQYPGLDLISVSAFGIKNFEPDHLVAIAGGAPEAPVLPGNFDFVSVHSVKKDAVEMTYDIAMEAPLNNYIANGIVVHNSSGMVTTMRQIRPTEFSDLVAIVALYRPGAMTHIPTYADRKNGRQKVTYLDPRLEEIQGETYGITIYQEQSMLIARTLAGFTPGQADDLRKAIGKKLKDKMESLRPIYMEGCRKNGVPLETAKDLWADNEAAADYSFNKAHAACYARISYVTAYLKANYPEEYSAALLSSVMGKKDKPRLYLTDAKGHDIPVLPPDINRSFRDFGVLRSEENEDTFELLFGLNAIRGVGEKVVAEIMTERKARGPFKSMFDLIRRMPGLNKTVLSALIRGGALDTLGPTRKGMDDEVEPAIERIKKQRKASEKAQFDKVKSYIEDHARPDDETDKKGRRKLDAMEKEGIKGGALFALGVEGFPDAAQLEDPVFEALKKKETQTTRATIRKALKETSEPQIVLGMGQEESADGMSEKAKIEAAAEGKVAGRIPQLREQAAELASQVAVALKAVADREAEEMGLAAAVASETDPPLGHVEWPELEKLNYEREKLGIYVTGHPLDRDTRKWAHYVDKGLGQIDDSDIDATLKVVGALVGKQPIITRRGEKMYKLTFEDLTGSKEVTVFPSTLEGIEEMLEIGTVLALDVRVEEDTFAAAKKAEEAEAEDGAGDVEPDEEGKPVQLVAGRVYNWDPSKLAEPKRKPTKAVADAEAAAGGAGLLYGTNHGAAGKTDAVAEAVVEPETVTFELKTEELTPEFVRRLQSVCAEHPGESPLRLLIDGEKAMSTEIKVQVCPELQQSLEALHSAEQLAAV